MCLASYTDWVENSDLIIKYYIYIIYYILILYNIFFHVPSTTAQAKVFNFTPYPFHILPTLPK